MRILCLLAEDPFPPQNGVTIPMYNHIMHFKKMGFTVDYIAFNSLVGSNHKDNKILRVFKELFFIEPYFTIDNYDKYLKDFILKKGGYDVIYYSPISMWKIAKHSKNINLELFNKEPKVIAAISDCYTSVLRGYLNSHTNLVPSHILKVIRSYYMGILEKKILINADLVLVQTKKDKKWLEKINYNKNIMIVTNGVDSSLLDLKYNFSKNAVYVANIKSDFYRNKLYWLVKEIWPKIVKLHPDAILHIYVGNYDVKLFDDFELNNIKLYTQFVDNLQDIYIGKTISIAPIFKDYGFINKVAESMASGLIVIGDSSAFNSIDAVDSFLVAESGLDFVECINKVFSDQEYATRISMNAKQFSIQNFSWQMRLKEFNLLLEQWNSEI